MNAVHYTLAAGCVATLSVLPNFASAEDGIRLPLERFRRNEEIVVQRGESVANGACIFNLVQTLRASSSEPTGWFITFETSSGVKFDSPEFPHFHHVCMDGQQITFDRGSKTVIQIYDDEGNPTLTEP